MRKDASRSKGLLGHRFGNQVVIELLGNGNVKVQCDCGTLNDTRIQYLLSGESRSCGCGRYESSKPVAVGDRFERLVIEQVLGSDGRKRQLLCKCECGTWKVVSQDVLQDGSTKSCGCLRRQVVGARNRSHGQSGRGRTYLYQAWMGMRERVHNRTRFPSYANVTIDPQWDEAFEPFRDYVGANLGERPEGHSLDRIDNAEGYHPGNVRWAGPRQQARNRKSTVFFTVDDKTLCLADWARETGISSQVIKNRLKAGWTEREALTTPVAKK